MLPAYYNNSFYDFMQLFWMVFYGEHYFISAPSTIFRQFKMLNFGQIKFFILKVKLPQEY